MPRVRFFDDLFDPQKPGGFLESQGLLKFVYDPFAAK